MSKRFLLLSAGLAAIAVVLRIVVGPGAGQDSAVRQKRAAGAGNPVVPATDRAMTSARGKVRALGIARADFLHSQGPEAEESEVADPLAELSRGERKLAERFKSGAGQRTGNFTVITADGAQPAPSAGGSEEGR